ncbi:MULTISPECIES: cellulase family glycosylhydrolase [Actinomadura]|uniref:Cellulase family glycosylhydrolase n=1 Tax=Actinomadura yumaensis TaxID=111807 RepID=A0ABW2CY90_9ACTN|nr:cellulase family glycosylhydrolase [Actinomadura sp. J1-007]MWK36165.1 cellulase family glycosylhydrolase [Actinomadura sp. J1-007]
MRARTVLGRHGRGRFASAAVLAASILTVVPATPAMSASPAEPGAAGTAGAPAADGSAPLPVITDDQGRALILHGLNTASSAKGPSGLPWVGRDDVVREAREIGTNSVRYLLQWKNVEPRPGEYDETYLDEVAERLAWYREQGMHVILDMHQDIYGPAACAGSGNGAPAWATYTDGLPCTPQDPWVLTYLQPAVLRAYDNLFDNTGRHPELARHYAGMWRHVAARFADEPAVLGYDLMNEPFGGTRQFGFFEGPVLTPFYQRIVDAIREEDRDGWIFVEPQALGPNEGADSSLAAVRDPSGRVVFAPHFYPGGVDLGGSYDGLAKVLVQAQFALWKRNMPGVARRLGTPMWLGEVGGMSERVAGADAFTSDWLAMADELGIGWAYWSNDPGPAGVTDADGRLTSIGRLLARPYPRAVAGTPTRISYAGRALTVAWNERAGASGPTELWLPAGAFPGTPKVAATDPTGTWRSRWDAGRRVLSVWADPGSPSHTLTVTP